MPVSASIPEIAGISTAVGTTIGGIVLAVMKMKFVSNHECSRRKEKFGKQIDKDAAGSREVISRKLDDICSEIKETRKKYNEVTNFMGRVEQYMMDHGGSIRRLDG